MDNAYNILIVDDNELAAQGLQKLLQHAGHTVAVAYTGAAALIYAAEHHPEVVILDIGLPDLSGYIVAERLRAQEPPPLLLIALSGYGQEEDKQKAFKAGFNHHLTKPIKVKDIQDLLKDGKHN